MRLRIIITKIQNEIPPFFIYSLFDRIHPKITLGGTSTCLSHKRTFCNVFEARFCTKVMAAGNVHSGVCVVYECHTMHPTTT